MMDFDLEIFTLNISVRTAKALCSVDNLDTPEKLARASDKQLKTVRGIGPKTIHEINEALLLAGYDRKRILAHWDYWN